jgi:ribonuclease HI
MALVSEPVNPYGNMGIGSVVYKDNQEVFSYSEYVEASKLNSNNVAEYLALEQILLWIRDNNTLESKIFIYGDSKLVINQMKGYWRVKRGLYVETAIRCKKIRSEIEKSLVFEWIPRELNSRADDLSKGKMIENKVEFKIQPQ